MSTVAGKLAKEERLELRLSSQAKALLSAAAKARQTTISEFVLSKGVEAAEKVLVDPRVFFASEEEWKIILSSIDAREPSQHAQDAVQWLSRKRSKPR